MTYRFRFFDKKSVSGSYEYYGYPLTVEAAESLIVVASSYCKIYNKTHGLLQRILRNRDIAVSMLMSMIFKVSFAISPIKFIISWSGTINKAQIDSLVCWISYPLVVWQSILLYYVRRVGLRTRGADSPDYLNKYTTIQVDTSSKRTLSSLWIGN